MATQVDITERLRGDTVRVKIVLKNQDSGDPVVKLWLTVKESSDDLDSAAIAQVILNSPSDFTVLSGVLTAMAKLPSSQTGNIIPGQAYVYDVQTLFQSGDLDTPFYGAFTMLPDVTRAVS